MCRILALSLLVFSCQLPRAAVAQDDSARVRSGLVALYDFADESGDTVRDRSGVGQSLDLKISTPSAVRRRSGGLTVKDDVVIASEGPAKKITDAFKLTHEITLEAWIRPAGVEVEGPARIVTLSKDCLLYTSPSPRDATLSRMPSSA